jgi:phosphoribosyl-dephospho-CoA transferase
MEVSSLQPHYLLKVDAPAVILSKERVHRCVPSWVFPALLDTSFVVVRRGVMTENRIPVGIRGRERSQRWAAWCPANAIRQIVTPADLLQLVMDAKDSPVSLPSRRLRSLATEWQWFTHRWGPGGSVGFELATGKPTTTLRSDLDIVVYAKEHLPISDAQRLLVATRDSEMPVDIRVETPVCGFSLAEYASSFNRSILQRTSTGPILGDDPWSADLRSLSVRTEA